MQLAQNWRGYTMAEADSLRKAMGKKTGKEMARKNRSSSSVR